MQSKHSTTGILDSPALRSIEAVVAEAERGGAKISLAGATLDIKAPMLGGSKHLIAELNERSAEAVGYLAGKRAPKRLPPSGTFTRAMLIPLSQAQAQLARFDDLSVQDQWLPFLWRMDGQLDVPAFVRAYMGLLTRHEILRTRYVSTDGGVLQEIAPVEESRLSFVDLTPLPPEQREMEIYKRLKPTLHQPVVIEDGVVRLQLYRLDGETHVLGGLIHHIAFDGRSLELFLQDLETGYRAAVEGSVPPAVPALQYADFALWENSWLTDEERTLAAAGWEYTLASVHPAGVAGLQGHEGSAPRPEAVPFALSPDLFERSLAFARTNGATLNFMFSAALSLVLGDQAGGKDALFGTIIQGRPPGFENVTGCFIQIRPFYLNFEDDPPFGELLTRARKAAIAASDIRKPVSNALISRLRIDKIVLNYIRETVVERPDADTQAGDVDQAERSGIGSFKERRISQAPEEWQNPARVRGRMKPLPMRLFDEFSRDLHVGVAQSSTGLSGGLTFGEGTIGREEIVRMAQDIAKVLEVAAGGGASQRVSDLMRTVRGS